MRRFCQLLFPLLTWAQEEDLDRSVRLPTGFTTDMVLIPAGSFPPEPREKSSRRTAVRMIFTDPYLLINMKLLWRSGGSIRARDIKLASEPARYRRRQNHPIVYQLV